MEIFKLVGSIFINNQDADTAIDSTTGKAKNLAESIGSAMGQVGEKISGLGTKLLPVSVAIAGLGVTAVKSSAEVKAMNSQFEQTFGELQDQASDAMGRVATESGILQTRLQGVGTSIYAFAKSSGADSAEAMSLMETALRATADASAYYDRSLEETSESLMSFLKGNFANDAQLGVSCTETTRNAKAMELFGQKYNDLSEIQKQQTLLKMVTDAQALSGAMGQASRESDGFENVMGNLKESVKQASAELGAVLLPTVIKLIQGVTGLVQKFSNMDDGTKKLIVTIAGIVAGLAPVLIVVGKVISSVGTIITIIPKVVSGVKLIGTGAKALWAILSANPIGLVIGIITALVAVFMHLWNTSEEFRNFWINLWNNIKSAVLSAWNNIKSTVSSAINNVKSTISNGLNNAKNTVSNVLNNIKSKFTSIWDNCKSIVSNAVSKLKSIMNFSWSLPHLKLPHITISGSFSLNPPRVPSFGISWYKKAMEDGMIMNQPTIFGYNAKTNQFMGGGEAGSETVVGTESLMNMIQRAVTAENAGVVDKLDKLISMLSKYFPEIIVGMNRGVVLDSGVLVGELAPRMDTELGKIMNHRGRGN